MATNLPPEYYEADKRYRAAKTPGEKISCIEELLRIVPKHKGTDKLRAGLRKRLSKLKTTAQAKKGTGKRESAFRIEKKGDTVEDFAGKVHQDFACKLKTARLWGTAVYDGQLVQRDHVLSDSDIVELQI